MKLLSVEVHRALRRRVVWVLVMLAVLGAALAGVIAFVDSSGRTAAELTVNGTHPAVMKGWWDAGGDSILMIAAIPLLLGGLIGGASVAGAEWRAGTVTTVLTCEPRRRHFHGARLGACAILAAAIAFMLQAVFLGAFVPAVLANGSTAGLDSAWWTSLVAAMARVSVLTSVSAVIGVTLATIGRNTAFGIVSAWVWLAGGEGILRAIKPTWAAWLLGDNVAVILTWTRMKHDVATPTPGGALVWVTLLVAALAAIGFVAFERRDVAA